MPIGVSQAPYAKYPQPGVRHGGEIVGFRVIQTTDQESRRPLYLQRNADGSWTKTFEAYAPDGTSNDPITQWEITVDTGVEDDNGDSELRIFVDPRKGRKNTLLEGKRGGDAVAIALKKAKAHRVGLEIGAKFFMTSGEKMRDGTGPLTNTWTAEYEPPEGGPGSGKPVDEVPWLVGGERYVRHTERHDFTRPTTAPVDNPVDQGARVHEVTDQLARAHASSPVLNKPETRQGSFDDEPPF